MRCRIGTPFGAPVDPDVKSVYATSSGPPEYGSSQGFPAATDDTMWETEAAEQIAATRAAGQSGLIGTTVAPSRSPAR